MWGCNRRLSLTLPSAIQFRWKQLLIVIVVIMLIFFFKCTSAVKSQRKDVNLPATPSADRPEYIAVAAGQ